MHMQLKNKKNGFGLVSDCLLLLFSLRALYLVYLGYKYHK